MLENITIGLLAKWRDTVTKHCYYGTQHFCDGEPAERGGRRRRPCRYYDATNKKCTQPKIARCKETMKIYLEGERRKYGSNT